MERQFGPNQLIHRPVGVKPTRNSAFTVNKSTLAGRKPNPPAGSDFGRSVDFRISRMTEPFSHTEPMPAAKANAEAQATAVRCWALIPCAGVGLRAIAADAPAPALPKQYQPVAGRPMVEHTLAAMVAVQRVHHVLLVISATDMFWQGKPQAGRVSIAACGGASRAETVGNGLKHLLSLGAGENDWVLVHDAARCLVTPTQVDALIQACEQDAVGGLLALKLPDTLKQARSEGGTARVAQTVERSDKWLAQTPQMFRIGSLLAALREAGDAVTDEASAMEMAGHAPLLVPGGAQNFKVTYPEDFALAEAVLLHRQAPKGSTQPQ